MECKMGNAIIILIFIFTPICFASDTQLTLPTNYLKELEAIFQNYKNGTLNAEQLEQNLKIWALPQLRGHFNQNSLD